MAMVRASDCGNIEKRSDELARFAPVRLNGGSLHAHEIRFCETNPVCAVKDSTNRVRVQPRRRDEHAARAKSRLPAGPPPSWLNNGARITPGRSSPSISPQAFLTPCP